ncbi:MAG: hypothetical protein ACNA7W_01275 [Pseudomonadales bacterium]
MSKQKPSPHLSRRAPCGRASRCGYRATFIGALLIALLIGTALLPLRAVANAFDRDWCELDAGEFRLVTDRSHAAAEDMAWRLQRFRPVAERYLPGVANDRNPPLRVVVFGRGRDFRRAVDGADVVGYMLPSLSENLMVVGPDPFARSEHETLLHEYVHYLLRTRMDIHIPTWFDEGLAGVLSTAEIDGDGVTIGALPRAYLEAAIRQGGLNLAQVLEAGDVWRWRGERRRAFYAWSWLLTHRLLLGHTAGLDDQRPALAAYLAGESANLSDALGTSSRALQRSLERYLSRSAARQQHHHESDTAANRAYDYRCLDAKDRAIELALAVMPHNPVAAARELRAQLADDDQDARLWVALSLAEEANGSRDAAVLAARSALNLAGDDGSAMVRLASALVMGCILDVSIECRSRWQEATPLLRRTLRQDPTLQEAIFILGLAYLYSGRPGDALNYLRIAHRRQPWAAHVNFYLGESHRLVGDQRRAVEHLELAQQWSPIELWRMLADAALAEIDPPASR